MNITLVYNNKKYIIEVEPSTKLIEFLYQVFRICNADGLSPSKYPAYFKCNENFLCAKELDQSLASLNIIDRT